MPAGTMPLPSVLVKYEASEVRVCVLRSTLNPIARPSGVHTSPLGWLVSDVRVSRTRLEPSGYMPYTPCLPL